ncbi:MAG TPA: sigma-70 family RNA polymerase sigma factor [Solirubrobacteraceae bacterium]|jgi:RNA polymerase sigma factor (sigma-70 family)|nr:sigma-70 family RNA polymerase sigma factor [Solirubrobacteraceae bacterium]
MKQTDTDVQSENGDQRDPSRGNGRAPAPGAGTSAWVGELLGRWQPAEVRVARSFPECRGLAGEQLEDLYQDTTLALLARHYTNEEHLRNALRHGIKHRALNVHRNQRRRTQILAQSAPSMQRIEEGHHSHSGPEDAALGEQDRLIATEFLTELSELEQRVFWLTAEGLRYRAIAATLQIPVNEARNASRSCERKRQRFQLLYDTGRLCGYRAATIQALQGGQLTSLELARRAFAHLDACTRCRAEHKTNAKRLSLSFREQIAAVLPIPALLTRTGGATAHHHALGRLLTLKASTSVAGVRLTGLLGSAGTGAKLTASAVAVVVLAAGSVGATGALERHQSHSARHSAASRSATLAPGASVGRAAGGYDFARAAGQRPRPALRVTSPAIRSARTARHGSVGGPGPDAGREFGVQPSPGGSESVQTAANSAGESHGHAEGEFGIEHSSG